MAEDWTRSDRDRHDEAALRGLELMTGKFADLASTELGRQLWDFLKTPASVIRMKTAVLLGRAPVEALGPGLIHAFGHDVRDDRTKQMIGFMVRQVMTALGYEVVKTGARITRPNLFTTGATYRAADAMPKGATVSRADRTAWIESMETSRFNTWLDRRAAGADGGLDLGRLYALAQEHGVEERFDSLTPAQQRLAVGALLRGRVPTTEVAS